MSTKSLKTVGSLLTPALISDAERRGAQIIFANFTVNPLSALISDAERRGARENGLEFGRKGVRIDLGCRKALSTLGVFPLLNNPVPHGSLMPKGVEHKKVFEGIGFIVFRIDLGCRKAVSTPQVSAGLSYSGPHGSLMPKGVEHKDLGDRIGGAGLPHGSLMPKGVEHTFTISRKRLPITALISDAERRGAPKAAIEILKKPIPHGSLMPKGVEHVIINPHDKGAIRRIDLGCRKAVSTLDMTLAELRESGRIDLGCRKALSTHNYLSISNIR